MMDPQTKKNKGFAFLRFETAEQAKRALIDLKNPVINGKQCGVMPCQDRDSDTLFLGNICKIWTKEALKEKLKHYGVDNVEDITLVEDSNNQGMNRGFAFLKFLSRSDATDAFRRLHKRDVLFDVDRPAKVSFADSFIDPGDGIMAQVTTIFILPPSWDEDRVQELLKKYGEIEKIELARNMPSADRKDYGFVTVYTYDAAVTCAKSINNTELGEGDNKAKVRARLARPHQKGRGNRPHQKGRGNRYSGRDSFKPSHGSARVSRDLRPGISYGGNAGFRPGPGPNFGVLRHPQVQAPGGLLPIQPIGSHGMMQRNNSDADRWQRAIYQQKGLIPSPHAPQFIMHRAERKQRQLKAILDKLTQNFDRLFEQVKAVNIDNAITLAGVVNQIFDKALMEPTFCEMYANICFYLAGELPDFSEDNEKITFKRLLLNKCQKEFERGEREQGEANKVEEGEAKQSEEVREEKRIQARRRKLGNIRLIGELYKKKMLTERIMHECIKKLLGQYPNPDEEDIEALCKLMSTIGEMIDHPKAKEHMDAYFDMMFKLSNNMKLSSRVRFMLKDAIDLRKNKWQQRRKVEGPKKIDEVHRDAAQERQNQARHGRGPAINSAARRGPVDFGSRGSPMLSSPGAQMSGFRGLSSQVQSFAGQDARFEDRQSFEARTLSVPDGEGVAGEEVEHADFGDKAEHEDCDKVVQERPKRKEFEVFVGGLDKDVIEDDLRKVFSQVGDVVEVRLMMNPLTKKNKGFAFLRFETAEQAKRALIDLKNPVINGKQCGVMPCQDRDSDILFLGNICKSWTKEALKEKLKHYGVDNVEDITLVEDSNNQGMNCGFAFLEFLSRSDATDAFRRLHKRDVLFGVDRPAKVSFADSFIDPGDEIMAQVTTIFILPPSWDEDRVQELLKKYGGIEKIEIARNMPSADRKDYGFVTFYTYDAAVTCAKSINNTELGEGDNKAKVRARLARPHQKGRGNRYSGRGSFRRSHGSARVSRDLRPGVSYGGNAGFRPGPGRNFGVLRHPQVQAPGGLLPVQPIGSHGMMQRNSNDADRWQRAPQFIKHRAERKQRQLKAILDKLTPQNFDRLFEQVKAVNIDNAITLAGVVNQIFDKALMEPTFCQMYANICFYLAGELPDFSEDNEKITFKRLLLNKCQEEFERGEREQEEANKVEEGEAKQSEEVREEKIIQARRRKLGNIRLIGELYKKKMLTERIMHECIKKLLGQYPNPDEEDIEALCKLMSTIGEIIDHPKAKEHMDAYFDMMFKLSNNMKLSSRVRFMLKDAIDLRKNKWQQRRKVEGPKKIDEVPRDAAQERQNQARHGRGPGINSAARRGPVDFGSRGSPMLSSPGAQMSGFRGLSSQVRRFAALKIGSL